MQQAAAQFGIYIYIMGLLQAWPSDMVDHIVLA